MLWMTKEGNLSLRDEQHLQLGAMMRNNNMLHFLNYGIISPPLNFPLVKPFPFD